MSQNPHLESPKLVALDERKARLFGVMEQHLSRRYGGVDLQALRYEIDRMPEHRVDDLLKHYLPATKYLY